MDGSTKHPITLLSVPFDWGAGRRGAGRGPESILHTGLERKLRLLGIEVETNRGLPEIIPAEDTAKPADPALRQLKHLDAVAEMSEALALEVSALVNRGRFPLVLGGDHSIAIGTIAGLALHYEKLGVLWFDAHSDLNTAETSPTGNLHGMSLAAGLGLGHDRLTKLLGRFPKLQPENVVIIGARDLDSGEKTRIKELGIRCYTMQDIDRLGMARVMEEAIRHVQGADGVHVSFDIDCVDPGEAPGTGTPVKGGMSYRESHFALELLQEAGIVTSAELVEVNPSLDTDGRTSRLAAELICSLLGETIL